MTTRRGAGSRAPVALAAIALVAAGLRIPFMWTGLGADEGGYAFVAHQWANGAHLYRDVFVDRPQGLMVLYRALTDVAYQAWAIRAGAVLAGVALTLLVGALGWMLRSRATGIAAAAIVAVVGVAPNAEGFTMEGELAAAVPATATIVCAVRWRSVQSRWWLVAAGFFGGIGVLMKQSGFDGLLVAGAIALAAAGPWRERAARVAAVAGGALLPLGAAIAQGLSVGWGRYWLAVYGWRAHEDLGRSAGGRLDAFIDQFPVVRPDLLAVTAVAALGFLVALRSRRVLWIAPAWLLAALAALNAGGLYLPHYFIQLIPPLALLAAIGATALPLRSPAAAVALTCLAIAPVAVTLVQYATMPSRQRERTIVWDRRYQIDREVARFVRAHSTPRDQLMALPSRADLYFLAHRPPPIPYLWEHTPLVRASTIRTLRRGLAGPERPKFVVVVEDARDIDTSGRLRRIVARYYRDVWSPRGVRDIRVLLARGANLAPAPAIAARPSTS